MTQKGTHTWDIIVQYHKCPHCDYIIESRDDYSKDSGNLKKQIKCPRCQKTFSLVKKAHHSWQVFDS